MLNKIKDLIYFNRAKEGEIFSFVYLFNKSLSDSKDEKANDFLLIKNEKEIIALIEILNDLSSLIIRRMMMPIMGVSYYIAIIIDEKYYYLFSKKNGYISKIYKFENDLTIDEFGIEIKFSELRL